MPNLDEDVRALASRLSGGVDTTGTLDRVRAKALHRRRARPVKLAGTYLSIAVIAILGLIPLYFAFHGTHSAPAASTTPPPVKLQGRFAIVGTRPGLFTLSIGGAQHMITNRQLFGPPSWSPDGSRLVLIKRVPGSESAHQLVIVRVATGSETVLTDFKAPNEPAWSPLGDEIAFPTSYGDIYVVHPDGTGLRQVTHSGGPCYDGSLSWSPDASQIAFTRDCNGGSGEGTYTVGLDGSHLQMIAPDRLFVAWSPDGRTLAFPRWDGSRGWALYLMGVDGTGVRLLTTYGGDRLFRYFGTPPSWSPDGKYLAVVRSGVVEIIALDGRTVASIQGAGGMGVLYALWSPSRSQGP